MALQWYNDSYGMKKYFASIKENKTHSHKKFYYYTTVDTLQKILETGSIFATNILALNDWREYELGAESVFNALKKKRIREMEDLKKSVCDVGVGDEEIQELVSEMRQGMDDRLDNMMRSQYQIGFLENAIKANGVMRYFDGGELYRYRYGDGGAYDCDMVFPEVYSISFSTQGDLLSQWKMYAKESGVAIELDFVDLEYKLSLFQKLSDGSKGFEQDGIKPRAVDYEIKEDDIKIKDDEWNYRDLFRDVPFYKDKGFVQENEYRLVFYPWADEKSQKCSALEYRISNHRLIPYLTIYCGKQGDPDELGWPIVTITVGPGGNQEVVYRGLVHYIEFAEYKVAEKTEKQLQSAYIRYYEDFVEFALEARHIEGNEIEKCKNDFNSSICGDMPDDPQEFERILYKNSAKVLSDDLPDIDASGCRTIFEDYCSVSYLASNGIIVRKSQIPYIYD